MIHLYDSLNWPIISYTIGQQISEIHSYKSDIMKEWGAFLADCHLKGEFVYAQLSCDENIEICNSVNLDDCQCYKESALEKFTNPLVFVIIPSLQKRIKVKNVFSHYEKRFIKNLRHLCNEIGASMNQSPEKYHVNPHHNRFAFDDGDDYFTAGHNSLTISPDRLENDINNELYSLCKSYDCEEDCKGTKASIVADTMTAEYHVNKGYLNSTEKPALFGSELLKLFKQDGCELKSDYGDALMPVSSDMTVIITAQPADDRQIIDAQYAYVPMSPHHNPLENDFTRLTNAINNQCYAHEIFDKTQSQKILVFKNECKIRRGRNDFDLSDLYAHAKHGNKREGMVSFQGVFELERIDDFERFTLRKIGERYNLTN